MGICFSKKDDLVYLLDECPICFYKITNKNKFVTPCCLQMFCEYCILKWKKKHNTCPLCRQKLK